MSNHTVERGMSPYDAKMVADQLRRVIELEKDNGYQTERTAQDYIYALRGVRNTIPHAKTVGSNVVLDIGAGSTRASHEFACMPAYKDIDFKATGLTQHPKIDEYIGNENLILTAAEVLRGIPDESVGAALSIFSITYSAVPKYVVESIDRVLVPGGIFKGTFRSSRRRLVPRKIPGFDILKRMDAKDGKTFEQLFSEKGYDSYLVCAKDRDILLAVKPAHSMKTTAKELYRRDLAI